MTIFSRAEPGLGFPWPWIQESRGSWERGREGGRGAQVRCPWSSWGGLASAGLDGQTGPNAGSPGAKDRDHWVLPGQTLLGWLASCVEPHSRVRWGAGAWPKGAGGTGVADLCFHLISSVVFQERWQDPQGRGGGGEATGRRHGPRPAPHVTPLADDNAAWKGLEASAPARV